MRSIFRVFLLLSFFVVSGCDLLSNAPETKDDSQALCKDIGNWDMVSNELKDNPQGYAPITWEEYSRIYALPAARISKIAIEHSHGAPYNLFTQCIVIKPSSGLYKTNDGIVIDSKKIQNLANSLTNLRLSSGMKECRGSEYNYATFDVEIEYDNGEKALLYSVSNCTENESPWNIVFGGKSYFQATGEIPDAVYEIISSLAEIDNWWRHEQSASSSFNRRKSFNLSSEIRPAGTPLFSEAGIYLDHLSLDESFSAYLDEFEPSYIQLECLTGTNCSEIESKVKLKSTQKIDISLDILFSGDDIIVSSPISADIWVEVKNKLFAHPFIQTARTAMPDLDFDVNCWMESECANKDWCADAHALLRKVAPEVELVCSVEFNTEDSNEAIFFPGEGLFWVKEFSHVLVYPLAKDRDEVRVMSWPPDMKILTDLFETVNFPSSVEEYGKAISIDADTGQCNSIGLTYDYMTVHTSRLFERELRPQSPAPIWVVRSSTSINQIDINGYCVFISPDGEFVLYRP
jgi:hypothetical protein